MSKKYKAYDHYEYDCAIYIASFDKVLNELGGYDYSNEETVFEWEEACLMDEYDAEFWRQRGWEIAECRTE